MINLNNSYIYTIRLYLKESISVYAIKVRYRHNIFYNYFIYMQGELQGIKIINMHQISTIKPSQGMPAQSRQ